MDLVRVMDVVYVTRDGENPELRYSLRSLENVRHSQVWIFGGAASWINTPDVVKFVRNPQRGTPYSSTRSHIAAACTHPDVSDPFMLWNDDFFAMQPVGMAPYLHRGPLVEMLEEAHRHRTPWWKGIIEADVMLERMGIENPLCYDIHTPIVIHKEGMLSALQQAKKARADAVALRTLYGNMMGLGGTPINDPKMMRRTETFPRGPWLSSRDNVFKSTVEPVLRYLFPDPSPYEKV